MLKTIFILVIASQMFLIAQPNYTMRLANPIRINNNTLEFDILLSCANSDFELSSYQCSLSFDLDLIQNDTICLKYIENSSELANYPLHVVGHDTTDGINELIFVSGIGSDLITSEEIRVGKFNICSSINFSIDDLNLRWNFSGALNTILTDQSFLDITEPSNHINFDYTITDVGSSNRKPNKFHLSQNYPNPFNPRTKIEFAMPEKGRVKLTIYNTIGERVLNIVDEIFSEGVHLLEIDASNLASGAYFYKLDVSDRYTSIKKMLLVK